MEQSVPALPLRVDIVSDVVCPWCVIGYKQLMKALESLPGRFAVTLHWHPFELNPAMPTGGEDLRQHLTRKYGTQASGSVSARSRLTALGDALGFHFDYHDGMRMVNTFLAHQLLYWADKRGKQTDLKLALFEAYFSRREDVSDREILVALAGRAGLDIIEARAVVSDGRFAATVRKEERFWGDEQEVFAVPTFRFQQQYLMSGAQEADTFARVLRKIHVRGGE
ncbi:MAG: DsbA family oxidoreductase [Halioglobus sp.]|nr:DsbA family oxidoreductase [Halioglobus sp.]